MASWNVGGGVSHIAGVSYVGMSGNGLFFNPLYTRPWQMTTCRQAKQGMRKGQDNPSGQVKISIGQEAWKNSGMGAGLSLPLCTAR